MPTIHDNKNLNSNYDLRMPKENEVSELRTIRVIDPRLRTEMKRKTKSGHFGEGLDYKTITQTHYVRKLD